MTLKGLREYAQAEGVSVELRVALELASDLSQKNGVSETVEYCEKVPCSSARSHIDFVLGSSVTDTCPTPVPRNMTQELGFHSLLWFVSPQLMTS
jgi:hypothetical protein